MAKAPKSSASSKDTREKKTAADKKGEAAKTRQGKATKEQKAAKAQPPAPPAPEAPPVTSSAIAGPGSAAVLDKPVAPKFRANPPRNPFMGTKNPRLDRG